MSGDRQMEETHIICCLAAELKIKFCKKHNFILTKLRGILINNCGQLNLEIIYAFLDHSMYVHDLATILNSGFL